MQAGDIVFVKGTGWISRLISRVDGGRPFTHVAVAVSPTQVVEAQRFVQVQMVEMDYEDFEVVDLSLTPSEREAVVRETNLLLGKRYDYIQIGWYLLKKVFRLKGVNPFNNPNTLICSELVSRVLYRLRLIEESHTLFDMTPNELYDCVLYIKENKELHRRPI